MAEGKIVQCIGAVVDVEFPRDQMPKVYDALKYEGGGLTLEVQQQLGDGVVRTIAMGASEGLKRGLAVESTGKAINVPSTSMMRPSVALPTGTVIGLPVLVTIRPRRRPSDEPRAMVRTTPSPSCCCTSSVSALPSNFRAS